MPKLELSDVTVKLTPPNYDLHFSQWALVVTFFGRPAMFRQRNHWAFLLYESVIELPIINDHVYQDVEIRFGGEALQLASVQIVDVEVLLPLMGASSTRVSMRAPYYSARNRSLQEVVLRWMGYAS